MLWPGTHGTPQHCMTPLSVAPDATTSTSLKSDTAYTPVSNT
ncbi:ORF095 [Infectious spleen and kidney necrosis virus]|uniref:ORF097R n=3 Tax=Infectious spleen and kidney necrosis virus TaxID=180170 RepID=Q8QUL3_ISKNN|nr:ORF097R [Infectious spleen and kidney necrosis virus]QJC63446.1 hypothetical protein [Banggai cardinalfish iridovirus]AAL98821.1 ORF097R [Infectious spleen and kidney necrosis virus]QOE77233.1 hypothetical protein [Banggai cardinalfish iridovirus]QPO16342.1 hypothetical protein [Infectious spleen and kidney necrosis virus]QPO16462.1 hypothetical protein [Infectious spleen and kidney necrosis virus]